MRGSKFPADMHNTIWCPIYIPSFMIIGSVISEELRWQDFGTDGRTDGRSDCTPRPAFAFGDAGKNVPGRHFSLCCTKPCLQKHSPLKHLLPSSVLVHCRSSLQDWPRDRFPKMKLNPCKKVKVTLQIIQEMTPLYCRSRL